MISRRARLTKEVLKEWLERYGVLRGNKVDTDWIHNIERLTGIPLPSYILHNADEFAEYIHNMFMMLLDILEENNIIRRENGKIYVRRDIIERIDRSRAQKSIERTGLIKTIRRLHGKSGEEIIYNRLTNPKLTVEWIVNLLKKLDTSLGTQMYSQFVSRLPYEIEDKRFADEELHELAVRIERGEIRVEESGHPLLSFLYNEEKRGDPQNLFENLNAIATHTGRCPYCGGEVVRRGEVLKCIECGRSYYRLRNIEQLVREIEAPPRSSEEPHRHPVVKIGERKGVLNSVHPLVVAIRRYIHRQSARSSSP